MENLQSKYRHTQINPDDASHQEIKNEIKRLKQLAAEKGNEEQAIKIFINSIYGASASPYFVCYNTKIAEAITLQGQDLNKYAMKIINNYFNNFWHKDKDLHKQLGITYAKKCSIEVVVYGDTDSVYVSFEHVLASCDWKGDGTEFILKLYENRIEGYINNCFDKYAEKWNTKNVQSLELEKISASAIILAKKKYVTDDVWKDPGVYYKSLEKITSKGVEIVQSSTPAFARKHLKNLLVLLFKEKKNLDINVFIGKLKELKEQFKLSEVEDISKSTSISDYPKYVIEDNDILKLAPKCPIHIRAGGMYNYTLNNSKWKRKYTLIKTKDKVRWYYSKGNSADTVFAYQPGNFPYEFAPEVNYDLQFSKAIIEPINRFLIAMGFGAIPSNLITSKKLF